MDPPFSSKLDTSGQDRGHHGSAGPVCHQAWQASPWPSAHLEFRPSLPSALTCCPGAEPGPPACPETPAFCPGLRGMVIFPIPSPLLPEASAGASAASIRASEERGREELASGAAPESAPGGRCGQRPSSAHVRHDATSLMHLLCWVSAGRGHRRQPTWPPSTTRRPAHALKLPVRSGVGGVPALTTTARARWPPGPPPVWRGPPAPATATEQGGQTPLPRGPQSPSSGLPAQTGARAPPTWRWIPPAAATSARPPASVSSCLRRPPRPRTASPPAASVPAAPWTGGGRGRAQGYSSLSAPTTPYNPTSG